MNRLVIIGNGFDMAHGLKTSYNEQFFKKKAYQPTCLHDFAYQPRWLSHFVLFQAYTMPTRCLHQPT